MRHKNVKHTGTQEYLERLRDEIEFIGRDFELKNGVLTVFAIDRKHGKKRREAEKKAQERDKRKEKFQRRSEK